MITPAISVLGAVEGLEIVAPSLHLFIVPVTVAIVVALFTIQKRATASVGRLFGPVMFAWFASLAVLGAHQVAMTPAVLGAINPVHVATFVADNPRLAFLALGAVVLAVTGTEAQYADMGHFGARPIRIAWVWFVMPALVLNLFRSGSAPPREPARDQEPGVPARPAVGADPAGRARGVRAGDRLAGRHLRRVFADAGGSVDGLCPRLKILHTSDRQIGQIYIPFINWTLVRRGARARARVQARG
jgi:KUP system potassium uptake protein